MGGDATSVTRLRSRTCVDDNVPPCMLGREHHFRILTLFLLNTWSRSSRLIILWKSKLLTVANSSKITTMLIMLIVPFTAYNPAPPSHPYTAAVIDKSLSLGALR